MATTREMILSNSFSDFILPVTKGFLETFQENGAEIINRYNGLVHFPITDETAPNYLRDASYSTIPKLFTILDTVSLEASGIIQVQTQPVLNLKGQDILLGFIDTGIDYTHPAFRRSDGSSRISMIWDQTIQEGSPPPELSYGTEYNNEEINMALKNEDPYSIVPSRDENGHGTFLAGVAAGSENTQEDFIGAVPLASIAMVKLKEAKPYLKDFFLATGEGPIYQETDILQAVRFLLDLSTRLNQGMVICIGLGSNQGSHTGQSPLGTMLRLIDAYQGLHVVVAAGNEANRSHHFYGVSKQENCETTVEILVPENSSGFTLELWGRAPEVYSVGFESPLGEVVRRIPPRIQYRQDIDFVLEKTQIFLNYEIIQTMSDNQMIFMRFQDPTPGVWRVRVYCDYYSSGNFHMWLPITGMTAPDIIFLQPNPDTTLTVPSTSSSVITTSAYNAYNNSLYLNSSRGYTSIGEIKPDIASPGVDVFGPVPGGGYSRRTGSSVAAAICAGAVAQIMEWGINRNPPRVFDSTELKTLLIRGADRSRDRLYPNREWGYGTLDVYQIFTSFISI